MTGDTPEDSEENRQSALRLAPLYLCIFLDLCGFGMVLADVQLRAQDLTPHGWPKGAVIGAILASTFVIQSLVSPRWGRLSDRVGRKPVFVACTLFSAGAMFVYASGAGIGAILLSRIIAGFGGANVAVAQAMLADRFEGLDRTAALGRLNAAITVGLTLGPAFGGWLIHAHGFRVMALGAGSASLAGVVLLAVFLPSSRRLRSAEEVAQSPHVGFSLLRDVPAVRRYVLVACIAWMSLAMLEGTFARLIQLLFGFDQREFGYLFGYEAFLGFVVQAWVLKALLNRYPEAKLLVFGLVAQGVGLALNPASAMLQAWIAPMAALILASTLFAFGSGLANPTLNGICSRLTPSERQGELFGLLQGTRSVGFVAGPVLGGILFDAWPAGPYVVAGFVSLAAAILVGRGAVDKKGPLHR